MFEPSRLTMCVNNTESPSAASILHRLRNLMTSFQVRTAADLVMHQAPNNLAGAGKQVPEAYAHTRSTGWRSIELRGQMLLPDTEPVRCNCNRCSRL